MSRKWNRIETWLAVIAIGVGGVLTAVAGLHLYVTATATPIHPDATRVSSVATAGTPSSSETSKLAPFITISSRL